MATQFCPTNCPKQQQTQELSTGSGNKGLRWIELEICVFFPFLSGRDTARIFVVRPPSWRLPLGSSDTRANSFTFGSLSLDLQSGQGLRIFPHIPPTRGSSGRPNTAAKRRSQLPSLHGVQLYSGVLIPVVLFPPGGRNSRLLAGVVRESSPAFHPGV